MCISKKSYIVYKMYALFVHGLKRKERILLNHAEENKLVNIQRFKYDYLDCTCNNKWTGFRQNRNRPTTRHTDRL